MAHCEINFRALSHKFHRFARNQPTRLNGSALRLAQLWTTDSREVAVREESVTALPKSHFYREGAKDTKIFKKQVWQLYSLRPAIWIRFARIFRFFAPFASSP
jgi:hypothetical protein